VWGRSSSTHNSGLPVQAGLAARCFRHTRRIGRRGLGVEGLKQCMVYQGALDVPRDRWERGEGKGAVHGVPEAHPRQSSPTCARPRRSRPWGFPSVERLAHHLRTAEVAGHQGGRPGRSPGRRRRAASSTCKGQQDPEPRGLARGPGSLRQAETDWGWGLLRPPQRFPTGCNTRGHAMAQVHRGRAEGEGCSHAQRCPSTPSLAQSRGGTGRSPGRSAGSC